MWHGWAPTGLGLHARLMVIQAVWVYGPQKGPWWTVSTPLLLLMPHGASGVGKDARKGLVFLLTLAGDEITQRGSVVTR